MIRVKSNNNYEKLVKYLEGLSRTSKRVAIREYADKGLTYLKNATPKDSGLTADSWFYTIEKEGKGQKVVYRNRNIQNGCPIAIILQYGHGTGYGGYVPGRDYINPAIARCVDDLVSTVWKEVSD